MTKAKDQSAYANNITEDCERVLVTLLRGLGPWKDSVYLVGGLAPRYLVPPDPERRLHAGTADVDIVVRLSVLADTKAYRTLEENLTRLGFVPAPREGGGTYTWRWQVLTDHGNTIYLEFLAGIEDEAPGELKQLPVKGGKLNACNFPNLAMVPHFFDTKEVTAELLDGRGVATETLRFANIVSYLPSKTAAFADRSEEKDAYDLAYCLESLPTADIAKALTAAMKKSPYRQMILTSLNEIKKRFCSDRQTEGYRKEGPRKAALFELGDGADPDLEQTRLLRQREISDAAEVLIAALKV